MSSKTYDITIRLTHEELTAVVTSYVRQRVQDTHSNNLIEDRDNYLESKREHLNNPPVKFSDITFFPVETAYGELEWRAENANGNVLFFTAHLPKA